MSENTNYVHVMPNQNVFTITTLAFDETDPNRWITTEKRTSAICTTLEIAEKFVVGNFGDMHEGSFTYAVIEEVQTNCMNGAAQCSIQKWYKWQAQQSKYAGGWGIEDGKYVPIETPEQFINVIGFCE